MKVNKLLKELKKIRNEYGNVEVTIFDCQSWENCIGDGCEPITEIDYQKMSKKIVLYQKGENKMDLEEILEVLLEDCDIDDIIIEDYEDFFIIEA